MKNFGLCMTLLRQLKDTEWEKIFEISSLINDLYPVYIKIPKGNNEKTITPIFKNEQNIYTDTSLKRILEWQLGTLKEA